jgi:Transposase DDE domain
MTKQSALIKAIEDDFQKRHPLYHKSRREGLALLTGTMLEVRGANLMELAAALPREIGTADDRYQYIVRQLKNDKTDVDATIKPYALEVIERLAARGQTVVLQLDQSRINDTNEVLMLSVRLRKRAVPVAWRVRTTQGNIPFGVQKDVLESVAVWLPEGVPVMLAADRFYGTAQLIGWCQKAGWSYRIRLKGNLTLSHEGGELTTGEAAARMPRGLTGAELYGSGVITNIGIVHDKGHKEPWIIAMNEAPSRYKTLDYGLRWGIENMFSDFKSRGFGLMQSHIQRPDRLDRLILVMAIALYWAVSCGMFAEHQAVSDGLKRGL